MANSKWKWFFLTALFSTGMGFVFYAGGIFLPWLLGPLIIMMILRNSTDWPFYWPNWLRNTGLLIVGVQMGTSFTSQALMIMVLHLPLMLVLTLLITGFTAVSALTLSKNTEYPYQTALLGSFPGGLSQMVLLSEEVKGAQPSAVALMQTIRILLVITVVPFLVTFFFPAAQEQTTASIQPMITSVPFLWLFLLAASVLAVLKGMQRAHFPIPFMLAPLLSVVAYNVLTSSPFALPETIIAAAQILLGAHLGLQMEGLRGLLSIKPLVIVVGINLALILFCIGLSFALNSVFSFPLIDMFLSAAPGGVAEMAITAYSVGADVSTVTSFHLFRIFFILFAAAPATVFLLKRSLKRAG
ncbi:AbrB family transcriptional regulator [Jeotgalibacillus sp. ET6]|uniref:AbrB family transcriptional regulator n=1 Tax=Jeotgalibacillus sp. ET6 TaxID=3037260 RepID=UPI00241854F9|nr:AbrB family transcriptional regulator [Jeotgalibacillus sp. ET6]MDG5470975.1 AbrB family transcriptional regulator [Jeotgalibacillus sp. ET6]